MVRHSTSPYLHGFAPPVVESLQLQFPVLNGASVAELDLILRQIQALSIDAQQRIGTIPRQVSDIAQISSALARLAVEDTQQKKPCY